MTIAFGCILAAMFIPLTLVGYAKIGAGGYDNRNPREFVGNLTGKFKRAVHAQQNAYEAFAPFAAAVIVAYVAGAPQSQADILAVLFIVFRIIYSVFYIIDQHWLRTLAWFAAFSCIIGLFLISL
ncbi:MAG: MAPEG family protein [Candidatus Omnitrophica bacterium]|nr:MAPEG family protein [Candidatus Omnitrophota bacterium]